MKRWLWILPLMMLSMRGDHKFYVSNTLIEFKPMKGMLEVTMKIFTDDLEEALSRQENTAIRFSDKSPAGEHKEIIRQYLAHKFGIKADNIPVSLDYLGKETEFDMTFLYLEGHTSGLHNVYEVTNSVLTEVYPDQINLINFSFGTKRVTLTLDRFQPIGHVYP